MIKKVLVWVFSKEYRELRGTIKALETDNKEFRRRELEHVATIQELRGAG